MAMRPCQLPWQLAGCIWLLTCARVRTFVFAPPQVRVLLRGTETVLGDVASDEELFVTLDVSHSAFMAFAFLGISPISSALDTAGAHIPRFPHPLPIPHHAYIPSCIVLTSHVTSHITPTSHSYVTYVIPSHPTSLPHHTPTTPQVREAALTEVTGKADASRLAREWEWSKRLEHFAADVELW